MKELIRRFVRWLGFELLHRTDDPILSRLRFAHETLRLDPDDRTQWDDTLPRLAAAAHLRHMLELHRIDLVIDVGANRGQFARLTRELGYRGDIVSFEPLAQHRNQLQQAATDDGRWKIVPVALGENEGEATLHVYADDSFSSLHAINRAGKERFTALVTENQLQRVPVRTLDRLWPELVIGGGRRVLLKTDTQGHDLEVLAGASNVLQCTLAVLVEASFEPIYEGASSYADLAAWLRSRGFVPSGLFPISHRIDNLALIEIDACFTRAAPWPPPSDC